MLARSGGTSADEGALTASAQDGIGSPLAAEWAVVHPKVPASVMRQRMLRRKRLEGNGLDAQHVAQAEEDVIHVKKPASSLMLLERVGGARHRGQVVWQRRARDAPETAHDKVQRMGRKLCEEKPDHPDCAEFTKSKDQRKEQEKQPTADEKPARAEDKPTSAEEMPAPVEEKPTPSEKDVMHADAEPTPVAEAPQAASEKVQPAVAKDSQDSQKAAPANEAEDETVDDDEDSSVPAAKDDGGSGSQESEPSHGLPSQGFSGKSVMHKNGTTQTSDWHNEYGNKQETKQAPSTSAPHSQPTTAHSGAGRAKVEAAALLPLALSLAIASATAATHA